MLKNYAALVDLELSRVNALMRYEVLSMDDCKARAKDVCDNLLNELEEMWPNTPEPLEGELDEIIKKIACCEKENDVF